MKSFLLLERVLLKSLSGLECVEMKILEGIVVGTIYSPDLGVRA